MMRHFIHTGFFKGCKEVTVINYRIDGILLFRKETEVIQRV